MRQENKFYISSFLKNQQYYLPVLILFLQDNLLSFQEIFWVFTIGSIISFIVEIPTGVIADLYGKRTSIIISKFLIFGSYIGFGFSHQFWHFILAQVILELGKSFRSGTETAYTFDYCLEQKINYTEVKGKQKFWARIGEATGAFIGGIIAVQMGYAWAFFIASIPAFLNWIISLSWEHIKEYADKKSVHKAYALAQDALARVVKNRELMKIVLNIAVFTAVVVALEKFIQPYMVSAQVPVEWFGTIYAIALIIAALGVRYAYLLEKKFGQIQIINALSIIAAVPLLIIGSGHTSIYGILLVFFVIIIHNIRSPVINNAFHQQVQSEQRATMGSILELIRSGVKIIILPVIGYAADMFSLSAAILILACVLIINGIMLRLAHSTGQVRPSNS